MASGQGARIAGFCLTHQSDDGRLVGAERVLAVLVELADHPDGVGLDELAQRVRSSKSTVHRALTSLRKAGLAAQLARGKYVLGDEFLRLAFDHSARRPETPRIEPLLRELAHRYGETAHYAVLDGRDVVYRAKVDPPQGGVRLTSVVGGRNPASTTAVGKILLSHEVGSQADLVSWLGGRTIERRTPNTITEVSLLWEELRLTRERGFATDDQENELGINCVAVAVRASPWSPRLGAVSVSGVAFRTPLHRLIEAVDDIRAVVTSVGLADDAQTGG